jgi:hypothetical protein
MAGEKSGAEKSWAELIGTLLGMIGMGWGIWWCAGCGKNSNPPQPPAIPKSKFDIPKPPQSNPSAESSNEQEASGPLVDARERVKKFEKKRAALQALLDKALGDRDELVEKLREAGVEKAADLKGNSRGQQLAGSLQRLTVEIDGVERSIAVIDKAIVEAQSVARRLERERAGISDDEMRKLAEQLREAEERTDGAAPLPLTPLDVEAAFDKALKQTPKSSRELKEPSLKNGIEKKLVGKWQVVEGKRRGTVEFTKGGTALVSWDDGLRNSLGESQRRATLKYKVSGNALRLKGTGPYDDQQQEIVIEVISEDEMIFVIQKSAMSFGWLEGRFKRAK